MLSDTTVLIDAYSQIFRSFYAVRRLTTSRGEPVNAIMVFTRLLLTLEKQYASGRGAMLFDCGRVAFRLELLPEYKANRPPMPDDLKTQIPHLREMAEAFGWKLLQAENFEADDLIGGICVNQSGKIKIVSSDKDLSQLVDDRVTLLYPGKGGGFEERGASEVKAHFGVAPELLVDYLALVGDSSDNIAGVPGIGPKSAADLLNTYGGISGWIDSPECLQGSRYYAKVFDKKELLERNLQLVKLNCQLPANWSDLDGMLRKKAPDWEHIRSLCCRWELKSILKELPEPEEPDFGELFSVSSDSRKEPLRTEAEPLESESSGALVQGELF